MSDLTNLSKGEATALQSNKTSVETKHAIIGRHITHNVRKMHYTKDEAVFKNDKMLRKKKRTPWVKKLNKRFQNKTIFSNQIL